MMPADTTMHWRHVIAAPHRLLFFGGVTALVVSMLWWSVILAGRQSFTPMPPTAMPPTAVHAWLMVYGIFPFFVLGFLMTAFVRWIGAPPLPAGLYLPVAFSLLAGFVLVVCGALSHALLAATGMAITALGWLAGMAGLARRLRAHPSSAPQPRWALAVLAVGWLGAALSAWGTATGHWQAVVTGPTIGLWGFLLPMVLVVGHRMLPFFAQGVLTDYTAFRPAWVPAAGALLFLLHTVLALLGHPQWLFLADGPLAIVSAWLLWRWQPWRARALPLLWTLFLAFAWMPVGLALSAVNSLSLAGHGSAPLGHAPLHALGMGVLTGMVMAMATRVSLGHAGRSLVMDRLSLYCFLILQLAVVARLVAEWPDVVGSRPAWLLTAAGLWLLAVMPWACRYGLRYWQPRVDGRTG